ncbi:chromosome segregation in meiosis protein 3 [Gaeumannomyces tritici R3-111a-1]|uniref:Chromosome segregation in meiosis protein n=1 Tax=Gaeumannomyces tritici (strain R3-111a-1) TaxID=644352 RepID=J3NUT2_GAET3|nr:chromosome segregation in meiosis protein 3 [Gaeumannomyces tritici R3-111a-1]EJT79956.1 chromosome segregation in meiosis protein 3 [Gaeumannomyces tritici R3-111a-1]
MPPKAKQALDAIDNYLPDGDDFEDPFASPTNSPTQSPAKRKEPDGGLGIDEEISVAKRARVPRVKLDETRLLSDKGIPALRKRAGQLKLKGKGHEFSDAARLLSFYQLWLDDVFPKAKFLDALAMVEKAGHKSIMHKQRMDWINESKPRPMDSAEPKTASAAPDAPTREPTRIAPIFEQRPKPAGDDAPLDDELGDLYNATPEPERRTGGTIGGEPDDEDLDALMAEAEAAPGASKPRPSAPAASTSLFGPGTSSLFGSAKPAAPTVSSGGGAPEDVDDDDLDALMAEAELNGKPNSEAATGGQAPAPAGTSFDDDEAAMAELEGMW